MSATHCDGCLAVGCLGLDNPRKLREERDRAYTERNRLVAFLARLYPSGLRKTAIEGWDPEWDNCVYIDTPEGQMSWHFHGSDGHLFAGLPAYEKPWDGHSTEEKYARLKRLTARTPRDRRVLEECAALTISTAAVGPPSLDGQPLIVGSTRALAMAEYQRRT